LSSGEASVPLDLARIMEAAVPGLLCDSLKAKSLKSPVSESISITEVVAYSEGFDPIGASCSLLAPVRYPPIERLFVTVAVDANKLLLKVAEDCQVFGAVQVLVEFKRFDQLVLVAHAAVPAFTAQEDVPALTAHVEVPDLTAHVDVPALTAHVEVPAFTTHAAVPAFTAHADVPEFTAQVDVPALVAYVAEVASTANPAFVAHVAVPALRTHAAVPAFTAQVEVPALIA
jgi:hypothetical protein